MQVDRIEWIVVPDPATAAAALQSGEVDWWENPITDLVPLLQKNRNITVDIADRLGNIGVFKRLGMNVDFLAIDWGTVGARRAVKTRPGQGGWQMFHTWHSGADCINPAVAMGVRASGEKAWFGWPNAPEVETQVTAWYEAKSLDEEKAAIGRLNKAALDN